MRKLKAFALYDLDGKNRGEPLEIFEAIKGRRSVRSFESMSISRENVEKLLEAATWAPSAGNIQPWEFVVVTKAETKTKLVESAFGQSFIEQAPVVIVVCANENRSWQGYGERGVTLYCIQDTAAAVQNIMLTACSLGLGTCWVGAFSEKRVKDVLKIPEGIRPVAIVPVGRPAESASVRPRRSMVQVVHNETF